MSYILDALKKAEAERLLGSVPSIHAQAPAGAPGDAAARYARRIRLLAIAMLILIAAGIIWLKPWQQPQVQTAVSPVPPERIATAAPSAPIPAPTHAPEQTPHPVLTQAPTPAPIQPPPTAPASATTSAAAPTAKAPSMDTDAAVGTLQDLPANIQKEIPAVVVGGYIYANNPEDRSVLIDKNLLREGDRVGTNLVLEKITPKGVILNFNGYRYRIAY